MGVFFVHLVELDYLLIFLLANLVVAWALLQSAAGSSAEARYAFTIERIARCRSNCILVLKFT